MMNNDYETLQIEVIKRVLQKGMNFVDIGANIGIYTVVASKILGKSGRVYSFEPEISNFDLLKKNIEINNCTNIKLENKAIGDKDSKTKLHIVENDIGTHSIGKVSNNATDVDLVKLDTYFNNNNTKIDIIKMDIEGYELFALKGMQRILKTDPIVFLEYDDYLNSKCGCTSKEFTDFLSDNFKNLYILDEKTQKIKKKDFSDIPRIKYSNLIVSNHELDFSFRHSHL